MKQKISKSKLAIVQRHLESAEYWKSLIGVRRKHLEEIESAIMLLQSQLQKANRRINDALPYNYEFQRSKNLFLTKTKKRGVEYITVRRTCPYNGHTVFTKTFNRQTGAPPK